MSDQQALDAILHSLARCRIDEKKIILTKTVLGRGAFGVVVLGEIGRSFWKRKKGMQVAVKQLQASGTLAENRKLALALVQELHVWAGLAHPNILRLDGFFLDDHLDRAWLISPYMENGNIRNYLDEHIPDMIVRFRMLGEVARGVAYLHQRNICHGDIKGANILIDGDGQAKLCDFGLTKVMESGTTAGMSTTEAKGTTRYMAPELFHNAARTKKSDVWAWSCLGLEILFDQIPYGDVNGNMAIMKRIILGTPPLDLDNVDVDLSIKQLFKGCWVAEPQERVNIKRCVDAVEGVLSKLLRHQISDNLDESSATVQHIPTFPTSNDPTASSSTQAGSPNSDGPTATASMSSVEDGIPNAAKPRASLSIDEPSAIHFHITTSDGEGASSPLLVGNVVKDNTDTMPPSRLDVQIGKNGNQNLVMAVTNEPNSHSSDSASEYTSHDLRRPSGTATRHQKIERHREELLHRPLGHLNRGYTLHNLGLSLMDKYRKNGDVAHLDESIDLHRQALLLRPEGHSERHHSLHDLGVSLADKYRKSGNVAHLDEAIYVYRQALLLQPDGHSKRDNTLYGLGASLMGKYRTNGGIAHLDEAIDAHRQALLLRPEGHPNRHNSLHSLGLSLMDKYRKTSDVALLDEVIDLRRQALILGSNGHPDRNNILYGLGVSLMEKYRKKSDVAILEEAIDAHRQALLLRPEGHSERHNSLDSLGTSLWNQYCKNGDVADLDEAIDLDRQALLLRPERHSKRYNTLKSLGILLLAKYRRSGDVVHLDEAINLIRPAINQLPIGHSQRDHIQPQFDQLLGMRASATIKEQGSPESTW